MALSVLMLQHRSLGDPGEEHRGYEHQGGNIEVQSRAPLQSLMELPSRAMKKPRPQPMNINMRAKNCKAYIKYGRKAIDPFN